MTFQDFTKTSAYDSFSVRNRIAYVRLFEHSFLADYCMIKVYSTKTHNVLKSVVVSKHLLANIKSYSALMLVISDEQNHIDLDTLYQGFLAKSFCPLSVSCDTPTKTDSQDGGNLPPPPNVSFNPTLGGNLLHAITIKNNTIKYLKARGSVTAVIELHGDKYIYHLPMDGYYKIKKIDDDCRALNGYPIGIKKHLKLCKKYAYDSKNERYQVA